MSNFDFFNEKFSSLSKLGELIEKTICTDPGSSLAKLSVFVEYILKYIVKSEGLDKKILPDNDAQMYRMNILKENDLLPKEIESILQTFRTKGNYNAHNIDKNMEDAKENLRLAYELAVWFMKLYGEDKFIEAKFTMTNLETDKYNLKKLEEEYSEQIINLEEELRNLKPLNYTLPKEEREKIKLLRIEQGRDLAKGIDLTDSNEEIPGLYRDIKNQNKSFNKKIFILIIVVFLIFILIILTIKKGKDIASNKVDNEKTITSSNNEDVNSIQNYSVDTKSIKKTIKSDDGMDDLFIFDIKYPYIKGEENNEVIDYINNKFKETAESIYNENLSYMEDCKEQYNYLKEYPDSTWSPYSITSSINIKYNKNGILSYGCETSSYYGGVHPTTQSQFYTYNLNEGTEMSIHDIFKGDAREIKRSRVIEIINLYPENFYDDVFENLDQDLDYVEFYLTEEGIVFYIPEYLLGPYSSGAMQTEPLDYLENKDIYKDFGQYKLW